MINSRWFFVLLMPLMALFFLSCEDEVSYSDMKKKEHSIIDRFISIDGVKVISFSQFEKQGFTTDVEKNEYVLLDNVYAQFVCNPKDVEGAKKIEDGESMNLLVRYTEYSMKDGNIMTNNKYEAEPDEMVVVNDSGSFSAAFSSGVMMDSYGTSAVPSGWLVVMPYLYFTRSQANLAEVNLIVPHTAGTASAATYVYPCFYEITIQPER